MSKFLLHGPGFPYGWKSGDRDRSKNIKEFLELDQVGSHGLVSKRFDAVEQDMEQIVHSIAVNGTI